MSAPLLEDIVDPLDSSINTGYDEDENIGTSVINSMSQIPQILVQGTGY